MYTGIDPLRKKGSMIQATTALAKTTSIGLHGPDRFSGINSKPTAGIAPGYQASQRYHKFVSAFLMDCLH